MTVALIEFLSLKATAFNSIVKGLLLSPCLLSLNNEDFVASKLFVTQLIENEKLSDLSRNLEYTSTVRTNGNGKSSFLKVFVFPPI